MTTQRSHVYTLSPRYGHYMHSHTCTSSTDLPALACRCFHVHAVWLSCMQECIILCVLCLCHAQEDLPTKQGGFNGGSATHYPVNTMGEGDEQQTLPKPKGSGYTGVCACVRARACVCVCVCAPSHRLPALFCLLTLSYPLLIREGVYVCLNSLDTPADPYGIGRFCGHCVLRLYVCVCVCVCVRVQAAAILRHPTRTGHAASAPSTSPLAVTRCVVDVCMCV